MLKEVLAKLTDDIEPLFEKLAVMETKEFIESVNNFVASLPLSAEMIRITELTGEIIKLKRGKVIIAKGSTAVDMIKPLEVERRGLLAKLHSDEGMRVFRKLAEYIIERTTDTIMRINPQDKAVKARYLDAGLREITRRCTGDTRPPVDAVEGVDERTADPSFGVPQTGLQERLAVSVDDFDGRSPGIILKG